MNSHINTHMSYNSTQNTSKYPSGFTLIELLITIAIIGILSSIAIPSYQQYTRKAHYTEIIQATAPFKIGIEECFQVTGGLKSCRNGKNGVPGNIINGPGLLNKISISDDGIITAIPKKLYGIKPTDIYILTPKITNNQLLWGTSGDGVANGYAN